MDDRYRKGQKNAKGQVICGAKKRGKDEPCRRIDIGPSGRCYLHNGHAAKGIASPHFKHGRTSKYLPQRLMGKFEEARTDPRLLELQDSIALVDTRIAELLEGLDNKGNSQRWQTLNAALQDMEWAISSGDSDGFNDTFKRVRSVVRAGNREAQTWQELYGLWEQRRKLVESERKRYVEMGQMVTATQLLSLIGAVSVLIKEHVTDKQALAAISNGIIALTGSGAALPGSGPD